MPGSRIITLIVPKIGVKSTYLSPGDTSAAAGEQ